MRRVDLLATGGTIASRARTVGGAVATDRGDDLLERVVLPSGVEVSSRDVFRLNSFAMTPGDMQGVLEAVLSSFRSSEVNGVVVTHGTDTMEETAFLVDLFLDDDRPVVFTGAQRSADSTDGDGPGNLRDAVAVASAPAARGLGVLIVFDKVIFPARGTRKTHTIAADSFSCPETGPVGTVEGGVLSISLRPFRPQSLDPARLRAGGVRVDIVAIYPGCDATALEAAARAGAQGIVLEASGAGNANPAVCAAVALLTRQGVVVVLSTRVHAGPVVPLYGGGGGVDLVAAGAVPAGLLRPSQARMLLIALLGTGAGPQEVRSGFSVHA